MVKAYKNNKFYTSSSGSILIADGACDQTLITKEWYILSHTGRKRTMLGAFIGRSVDQTFPVVSAICKLTDEDGKSYAGLVYEALYDNSDAQT